MAIYDSHNNGSGPGLGSRVDHLNDGAQKLIAEARSAVSDLSSSVDLNGRVQRNPYGMVAAALGIGYVLGGGLFTPMTARLIKLGIRLAALPLVKEELAGMAEAAFNGLGAQGGFKGPSHSPHS